MTTTTADIICTKMLCDVLPHLDCSPCVFQLSLYRVFNKMNGTRYFLLDTQLRSQIPLLSAIFHTTIRPMRIFKFLKELKLPQSLLCLSQYSLNVSVSLGESIFKNDFDRSFSITASIFNSEELSVTMTVLGRHIMISRVTSKFDSLDSLAHCLLHCLSQIGARSEMVLSSYSILIDSNDSISDGALQLLKLVEPCGSNNEIDFTVVQKLPKSEQSPQQNIQKLYLLAGQSNMAGRGTLHDVEAAKYTDDVFCDMCPPLSQYLEGRSGNFQEKYRTKSLVFDVSSGSWTNIGPTIHEKVDIMKVTGIGPANSFVCRFIDLMNPEGCIGLVPAAVGATSLVEWSPSYWLTHSVSGRPAAAFSDMLESQHSQNSTRSSALPQEKEAPNTNDSPVQPQSIVLPSKLISESLATSEPLATSNSTETLALTGTTDGATDNAFEFNIIVPVVNDIGELQPPANAKYQPGCINILSCALRSFFLAVSSIHLSRCQTHTRESLTQSHDADNSGNLLDDLEFGILWYQGENDATLSSDDVRSYGERFQAFLETLRSFMGILCDLAALDATSSAVPEEGAVAVTPAVEPEPIMSTSNALEGITNISSVRDCGTEELSSSVSTTDQELALALRFPIVTVAITSTRPRLAKAPGEMATVRRQQLELGMPAMAAALPQERVVVEEMTMNPLETMNPLVLDVVDAFGLALRADSIHITAQAAGELGVELADRMALLSHQAREARRRRICSIRLLQSGPDDVDVGGVRGGGHGWIDACSTSAAESSHCYQPPPGHQQHSRLAIRPFMGLNRIYSAARVSANAVLDAAVQASVRLPFTVHQQHHFHYRSAGTASVNDTTEEGCEGGTNFNNSEHRKPYHAVSASDALAPAAALKTGLRAINFVYGEAHFPDLCAVFHTAITPTLKNIQSTVGEVSGSTIRTVIDQNFKFSSFVSLGCGAGPCVLAALLAGKFSCIIGIDIYKSKLEECRETLTQLGILGDCCSPVLSTRTTPNGYQRRNWHETLAVAPAVAVDGVGNSIGSNSTIVGANSGDDNCSKLQEFQSRLPVAGATTAAVRVETIMSNFLLVDWSHADLVYTCATCYDAALLRGLVERCCELRVGARIIMVDSLALTDPSFFLPDGSPPMTEEVKSDTTTTQPAVSPFELIGSRQSKGTWGECCAYIFEKIR